MEAMSEPSPPATTPAAAHPASAAPDATGPARAARDSGAPKTPMNAAPLAGSVAASPATATYATATAQPAATTPADHRAAHTGVQFPVRASTTTSTAVPPPSATSAGAIGGALFSLILVVALILALGWLARRMPGIARGGNANGLRVVATLPIGQRERLMVVEVGDTQLLIGAGPGGIHTLHTLDQPLPESSAPAGPSPFAQMLAQHFGKKTA